MAERFMAERRNRPRCATRTGAAIRPLDRCGETAASVQVQADDNTRERGSCRVFEYRRVDEIDEDLIQFGES